MLTKTKYTKRSTTQLSDLAEQAGILLMSAALTFGMLEMPSDRTKVVIPNQPSFAFAGNSYEEFNNPVSRERDETAPHFISYSEVQRTPSRTGKL